MSATVVGKEPEWGERGGYRLIADRVREKRPIRGVEGWRVAFDGDDGKRVGQYRSPEGHRAPCVGVRRGSCPDLCASVPGRRHRGRRAWHGGCSCGKWALHHRSVSCGFGLDEGKEREWERTGIAPLQAGDIYACAGFSLGGEGLIRCEFDVWLYSARLSGGGRGGEG